MVGGTRILRGHAITSPVGDPTVDIEVEEELRRKYMDKALEMLTEPGQRDVHQSIK